MGSLTLHKTIRFIQLIGLSQAVFWSAPSLSQNNQGLKFPDAVCPCISIQECPKIFGSVPEDKDLGTFPPCQLDGYIRCCGLSSRRDARALNEHSEKEPLVTSSTTYREKYQLPPGIVFPVPFVYPEYVDSRKTVKVSNPEVPAPLVSRAPLAPLAPLQPLAPPPKLRPALVSVARPEVTSTTNKFLAEITRPPVQKLPVGIHAPPVGFIYPEYLEEIKRKEAKDREEEISRKKATLQDHSTKFEFNAFPISTTNSQRNFNRPDLDNIRQSSVSLQDHSQKETPKDFSGTVRDSEKFSRDQDINNNQASNVNTQDLFTEKTPATFPIVSASFEIHSKNEPVDASQGFSVKNTDVTGLSQKPSISSENEDFGVASLDTVREIIASENALTKPDRIPEVAPFSPRRFPPGVTPPPLNFMYPEYVDLRNTKQENQNLRNFENTRIPIDHDEPENVEIQQEEITPPPFEFVKSKNVKSKHFDVPVKSIEPLRILPVDIRKPLLFQKQNHFNTFQNSQPDKKVTIETTPTENKTSTFSTLILNTLDNLRSSVSQLTSGISMNSTTTTTTVTSIPPTITRSQKPLTNSVEIRNVRPPQAAFSNHGESEVKTFAPLIVRKIPVRLQTVKQRENFTPTTRASILEQELSEIPQEKGFKNVVVQAEDVALISGKIIQRNPIMDIRLNAPTTRPKERLPHRQGQSFVRNRGNVKHATSTISEGYSKARVIPQRQGVNVGHVRDSQKNVQPRLRLPARSFESLRSSQVASSDEHFSKFNNDNIPKRLERPPPSLEMPSQADAKVPLLFHKHTLHHSDDGTTDKPQRDENSEHNSQTENNNHEGAGRLKVTMTIGNPPETFDRLPVAPTVPVTVEIIPSTADVISSSVATVATTTTTNPLAPVETSKAVTSTRTRPPGSQSMKNILIRRRPQYFSKKHGSVRQDSIMPVPTLESKVEHLAGVNRHEVDDPEVQKSLTFLEDNKVNFGSRVSAHQPTRFTSEGSGTTRNDFPRQRFPSETFTHDERVTHPNGSGLTKSVDDNNVPVVDAPLNNKIRNNGEGPRRKFRRMMLRRRPNFPRDSNRGFPTDSTKIEPQSGTDLSKENNSAASLKEEKIQTNEGAHFPDTPTLNRPSLKAEAVTLLPTLKIENNLQVEESSSKQPASEESAVLPPVSSNIEEDRPRFKNILRNPMIVKEETTAASIENISNSLSDNDVKYFIRRRPKPGRRTTTSESPVEASKESFAIGRRIARRRPGVASRRRTLQDEENENINVHEEHVQHGISESVRERNSRKIKADEISVRDMEESETGTSLTAPETGVLKINNTAASTGPYLNSSSHEELINVQQEERMEMSRNDKDMNVNLLKIKEKEAGKSSNKESVVYETATSISVVTNGRVLTLDEVKLLNESKKQRELEDHVDISEAEPSTLISFDSVPLAFSKLTSAEDHSDSLKTQDSGNDRHQISKPTTPASGTMNDEILETTDKGSNESGPIEGDDSASKKTQKSEETTKEYHENLVNQESINSLEKTSKTPDDPNVDLDSVKPEVLREDGSKKDMEEDVSDVSIKTFKKLHKQLADVKDDEKIISKLEETRGDEKQLSSWDQNHKNSGTAVMRVVRTTIQDFHQLPIFESKGFTDGSPQEHNLRMNDLTAVNVKKMESVTISPDDIARPGRISIIGPIPPGFKDIAISPEEELSLDLPNLDGVENFRSFSEPWKSTPIPFKMAVPSRIEPLRPVAKNLSSFKASPLDPFKWL